jgi:signal transduction histidine kinase
MNSFRLRRRSTPIIAILVATAALAGVLTYQAWEAAHYQRATAINAVRDYAEFAAWEFSLAAKEELYQRLVSVFSPIRREKPLARGASLPPPNVLSNELADDLFCPNKDPWFFRVDFPTGHLHINGEKPSLEMQRWIVDTIAADLVNYRKDWSYSTVAGNVDGQPCSIVYQVKYDHNWKPAAAFGFQMCVTAVAEPSFVRTMHTHKLLPPSLTKDAPNDSLMSVILYDAAGHELWRTRQQFPLNHAGVAKVPYFGGLVTKVALNPRYTDALIIGGLPRSRVPLLFGVMALTIALAVIGVIQLRREDELARLRGDFIASVSHELRTPLAQLRMFAETLLLGRVRSDGERQRSLEIVDQEARRLSHLVENILQFSRAERHAIKLAPTDAALAPQIAAALETFEPIARARQVRVVTSLDEELRGIVDAGALRQILLNLLDNAVKYGPVGQEVLVSLEPSVNRRSARIIVEDQGPGIPQEHRDKVWEPFYRLDRDAESAVAGSGIGLSVVRELARRHGGEATIEESTRGTRFVVVLPLCGAAA